MLWRHLGENPNSSLTVVKYGLNDCSKRTPASALAPHSPNQMGRNSDETTFADKGHEHYMKYTPSPQRAWKIAVLRYAKAINDYVHAGKEKGWDTAGDEPKMLQIKKSLEPFLTALKAVNQPGVSSEERAAFRDDWPPAHEPLISHLQQNGQSIDTLFILNDGSILARIGSSYEDGHVVHIQGDSVVRVDNVEYIGRCPARRYFAVARASGVQVTDGWQGPVVALCPWPSGREGLPAAAESLPLRELTFSLPAMPTKLQPFPDGQRVLLVCSEGIFVLASEGATRLLPRPEELAEELADDGLDADDFSVGLSMEHGAVSPDGLWVAVGCQDGPHKVFNAALDNVGTIVPASEYPHYALFNSRCIQLAQLVHQHTNGPAISCNVMQTELQHKNVWSELKQTCTNWPTFSDIESLDSCFARQPCDVGIQVGVCRECHLNQR